MSLFSHDDHKTCFTLLAPGHQAATDVAIYCEESPLVVYVLPVHSPQLQSVPEEVS